MLRAPYSPMTTGMPALMYFLYSALGWTVESTYRSLGETYRARKTTKEKKIINSGFLNGPLCPIYGAGAMVFEILLTPFKKQRRKKWKK